MTPDFATLSALRMNHPAWRLLRSDHAPLIASFLHRIFIAPNLREITAADLAEALEDELFMLRQQLGDDAFPKAASAYLNDWSAADKGWLRKFYRAGSDEAQFDLTPATEKAIAWLLELDAREFVGTESRLLMLFDLLKQMSQGTEPDANKRIEALQDQRDALDREIERIRDGDVSLLDETAVKERFQQFVQGVRALLMDFREVEHNFRSLDRRVRERIALWDGSKGALLESIMGERDAIADSDQGKSFRAFWEFLLSTSRQEELTRLIDQVLALPAVAALSPDKRTRRVHYDWIEAGEYAQRTVAQLSQQLRRFLDEQAWLENRRIMEILRGIEGHALNVRDMPPAGAFMEIDDTQAAIELAMERVLFNPALKISLANVVVASGEEDIDPAALFDQVIVDKSVLSGNLRQALQDRDQITLTELLDRYPLRQGLAEIVAYLQISSESFSSRIDEDTLEQIHWQAQSVDGETTMRSARMPRVIFLR
ncbi:DUF3375 domain-containing protein [Robbsia sp. KACC 23696]|uniref:DUF3375 domain-containing protein n=1 Tax=Robbsia sp. KACC 23696 TaxID=3149231 RepID=UPI00325C2D08